jgi:glucose/arabinose dehydrogenase
MLAIALLTVALVACAVPDGAGGPVDGDDPPLGDDPPSDTPPPVSVTLQPVASGFDRPLGIEHAPDASGRLFVVERPGTVRLVSSGAVSELPYLDISHRIYEQGADAGETGLLGMTFHPGFAENGRLFLHYTDEGGLTTIAELTVAPADSSVDDSTLVVLLQTEPATQWHQGGQIAFGPDGYLYVALGDGGPQDQAQDLGSLQGAVLRVDVDGAGVEPYEVPADNPFVADDGARPEIWAYGLRNPWRLSFDTETGDLWIADVGEKDVEEVNWQPAGSPGGENYGWPIMEGDQCYPPGTSCDDTGLTLPAIAYDHGDGWGTAVTGGFVYRGDELTGLQGWYVFGDFMSGRVFAASLTSDGWDAQPLLETGFRITSFGQDAGGELYLVDYADGALYRLGAE